MVEPCRTGIFIKVTKVKQIKFLKYNKNRYMRQPYKCYTWKHINVLMRTHIKITKAFETIKEHFVQELLTTYVHVSIQTD